MNPSLSALLHNQPTFTHWQELFNFAHELAHSNQVEQATALLADHMMQDVEDNLIAPVANSKKRDRCDSEKLMSLLRREYQDSVYAEAKHIVGQLVVVPLNGDIWILSIMFGLYSRRCVLTAKPEALDRHLKRINPCRKTRQYFEEALKTPVIQSL